MAASRRPASKASRLVAASLRDHATEERVDRVWDRLEADVRGAPSRRARPLWGLTAAAAIFGLGVLVGRESQPPVSVESAFVESDVAPEVLPVAAPAAQRNRERARVVDEVSERARVDRPRHARRPAKLPVETETKVVEVPVEVAVVEAPAEPARWQILAERGEYAAAFQAVDEVGGFDAVVGSGSPEELMILVDVARAAGQQGRAIQALRSVLHRYPEDENAPLAAMMLGNLLSRAGDSVGAAHAYALNRRLSPRGDFAEDALAREFEVALEANELERARALATQYEEEFPEGRRLAEIRDRLHRAANRLPEEETDDELPGPERESAEEADGSVVELAE